MVAAISAQINPYLWDWQLEEIFNQQNAFENLKTNREKQLMKIGFLERHRKSL
jgi:hypothetical protein